jgi:hypothetical protein
MLEVIPSVLSYLVVFGVLSSGLLCGAVFSQRVAGASENQAPRPASPALHKRSVSHASSTGGPLLVRLLYREEFGSLDIVCADSAFLLSGPV